MFFSHFIPSFVITFNEQELLRTPLSVLPSLLHLDHRHLAEIYFDAHSLSFFYSTATSFHKSLANRATLVHNHWSLSLPPLPGTFFWETCRRNTAGTRRETGKTKKPHKQQQPNKNFKKHSICLKLMQALTLLSPKQYIPLQKQSFLTLRKVLARDELQYSNCQKPVTNECWRHSKQVSSRIPFSTII